MNAHKRELLSFNNFIKGKIMSYNEIQFIKKMGYEMGKSFFSSEKQEALNEVDPDYILPWNKGENLSPENLETILSSLEENLSWEIGEFFDDKNLTIIVTYKYSNQDDIPEIDFNELFSVELLNYVLFSGQSELNLKSTIPSSGSASYNTSYVDDNVVKEISRKFKFDILGNVDSLKGSVTLKLGLTSGYDIKVLSKDDLGDTFEFQGGSYKLVQFEDSKILLEVIKKGTDFNYVCTNADDLKFKDQSLDSDSSGMGNSKVEFQNSIYDFFKDNPDGSFGAFSEYFDQNSQNFTEDSDPVVIGFTSTGIIDKLYLYNNCSTEKTVKMILD